MKKLLSKENLIILFLGIYILTYNFILNFNINRNVYNIISWIVIFIFTYALLGYNRNKAVNKKITIQYIIIYLIIYGLLTYFLGLITGFYISPFSLKLGSIIKNILNVVLVIIFKELTRYMLVFKTRYNKFGLFLNIIIFTCIDIIMVSNMYEFSTALLLFTFIGEVILRAIYNNILQTIIVRNVGAIPSILFKSILDGYIYMVPIIPNLGVYLITVVNLVLPVFIILKVNKENERYENISKRKVNISKKYISVPIVIVFIIMISLISGIFKYKIIAIASDSMLPVIARGDAVIYEKVEDLNALNVGDVLVFKNENTTYIHRITEISKKNKEIMIYTKGDNNMFNDDFITTEDEVIGVVKLNIKYIGYPTCWFNELID